MGGAEVNNLAYTSQDPEKVGPRVEELLRKELGESDPLPYHVVDAGGVDSGVATFTVDTMRFLFGGKLTVLFTLVFDLARPRPFQLQAHVIRQGIGSHVGALLYAAPLGKPVAGECTLGDHKTFGSPKFSGDAAAAGKLNASGDLLKRADKFARTSSNIGGIDTKLPRFFRVGPAAGGGLLQASTLPRSTSIGMGAAMDAREFCDLAALVEAAL